MSRRVRKSQRVIQDIAVPVQTARIPRLRHNRVRRQETANGRIIPARIVVVQARAAVPALAGVAIGRELAAGVVVLGIRWDRLFGAK